MGLFDSVKDMAEQATGVDLDQYLDKLPNNITELFDNDFMKQHTQFESIKNFFSDGGFNVEQLADVKNVSMDTLNNFVNNKTDFGSWQEMLQQAGEKFLNK